MFSLLLATLYLALTVFKTVSARLYRNKYFAQHRANAIKQAAVLQPILSGDPKLASTLESNLNNLEGVTFYWLLDDNDHTAITIADSLIQKHPNKAIVKLVCPPAPEGINPKLFKLSRTMPLCEQEYCVVLDDDTTLPQKTLQAIMAGLTSYELVTGLPQYRDQGSFYSRLLAAFVNNNAQFTYLSLLPYMEPITINGMCYGFKRKQLQSIGGFEPILPCLTDDLAIAEHVLSHGGRIQQIPLTQTIETSIKDAKHYVRQMHRWYVFANILFFKQNTAKRLLIFSMFGLSPLILTALLVTTLSAPSLLSLTCLLLTSGVRQLLLKRKVTTVNSMGISLLSELLQSAHLLHAFFSKKIRWRSRYYLVDSNSRFTSISQQV